MLRFSFSSTKKIIFGTLKIGQNDPEIPNLEFENHGFVVLVLSTVLIQRPNCLARHKNEIDQTNTLWDLRDMIFDNLLLMFTQVGNCLSDFRTGISLGLVVGEFH